mmetsp:Transcript_58270/g.94214  ORF Transcript_58270/g.94214 Transcript_58270/m.94214 type:complete len:89 (-) Transcript_58270:114-380(-)
MCIPKQMSARNIPVQNLQQKLAAMCEHFQQSVQRGTQRGTTKQYRGPCNKRRRHCNQPSCSTGLAGDDNNNAKEQKQHTDETLHKEVR